MKLSLKGKTLFILFFFFLPFFSFGQNPLLKMWDHRYGGTVWDGLTCFDQTTDGGYILGGYSVSGLNGDKTQASWGSVDYWIVKVDSLGRKQWDKVLGGTFSDDLYAIQQTNDGGYILAGSSASAIGGDKSEPTWGPSVDFWIVKIDSLGNKQWDKDYGGIDIDVPLSVVQTSDSGYLIGGLSSSGISGNKTQSTWGGVDYWIIKIDSLGNFEWDKDFGGTDDDRLYSLQQTTDGSYILGGFSDSYISGNKTQATWGFDDFWIIKIDSLGNIQWDKDFGGTLEDRLYSLQQTVDGGYILGGCSRSGIGGSKSQPTWGEFDYWIVKIDSAGNKQWDKDFGGNDFESGFGFGNVLQTLDGGYLISGSSESPISGDKTENNLGIDQVWLVKTDSSGLKLWDKTIFTMPDSKCAPFTIQSDEACYTIGTGSFGNVAGYKTEPNWDTTLNSPDYWIIKFCDSTFIQANLTTNANLCTGACIDFLNLSFNATNYQWNFQGAIPNSSTANDPTNICYPNPGTYDVQLIASNTYSSDTLLLTNYITVYPSPAAQAITQSGDTLFAIAGAATYQWYYNSSIINGATNYFHLALASGDYNVVATDTNGCEVEAAIFNVVAGSPFIDYDFRVSLFPNPVDETVTIYGLEKTVGRLSIFNLLGETVYSAAVNRKQKIINCKEFSPGLYYLQVTDNIITFSIKFVKN